MPLEDLGQRDDLILVHSPARQSWAFIHIRTHVKDLSLLCNDSI